MILRTSTLLSALALGLSAQAQAQALDYGVYGLGTWNKSYAFEANDHPNNTHSVPFSIGTGNYTFQVNVAELTPTDYTANSPQNPRQAASFYNILWEGGKSFNQSLRDAVTTGTGEGIPQLCLTVPMGPMSQAATNGYREQDNGDCSHAFGKQCMADLKKIDASTATASCDGMWMPKSCLAKFGNGGLGSAEIINPSTPSNETSPLLQYSPIEVSFYSSQIFEAGNSSFYAREDERLHAIFLSGIWGVTPVCNRVNNTKLDKNNIAVAQSGATGLRGSAGLLMAMAVAVAMFML
ncbi:hypothetical protein QM012_007264 [Aureobasidium pullulans]|uniref:Uncharacterized protein n=1 Tax=Aureobasidium pullulans TaxID=5580 RepID=A0ABR0TMN9_AURPU